MALTVRWKLEASFERIECYSYWNKRNKSKIFSNKLDTLILDSIDRIKSNPYIAKNLTFNFYYVLIHKYYWLVYSIEPNEIIIHAFWDARQNPDKLNLRLK